VTTRKLNTRFAVASSIATAAMIATAAEAAGAELIAYWHFNDYPSFSVPPNPTPADVGSGLIYWYWDGPIEVQGVGTDVNALPGYPGGQAVVQGSFTGEGTVIMDFVISMTGLQNLVASYATMGSEESWTLHTWHWSVDGENFTEFESAATQVNWVWQLVEIDFSSVAALNNASEVTLRLAMEDAGTSAGFTWVDNIQLNGALLPSPGVLALLGIAGSFGRARRRRTQ
jgi:hypothetical protein